MAKLDVRALGLAFGITWGAGMFALGVIDMFTVWGDAFGAVMSTCYIGYSPTLVGSIIGGVWGFFDAGIAGVMIGWLYNKFAK